jgi:hypothetical protein
MMLLMLKESLHMMTAPERNAVFSLEIRGEAALSGWRAHRGGKTAVRQGVSIHTEEHILHNSSDTGISVQIHERVALLVVLVEGNTVVGVMFLIDCIRFCILLHG